jgi:hypothetical protein
VLLVLSSLGEALEVALLAAKFLTAMALVVVMSETIFGGAHEGFVRKAGLADVAAAEGQALDGSHVRGPGNHLARVLTQKFLNCGSMLGLHRLPRVVAHMRSPLLGQDVTTSLTQAGQQAVSLVEGEAQPTEGGAVIKILAVARVNRERGLCSLLKYLWVVIFSLNTLHPFEIEEKNCQRRSPEKERKRKEEKRKKEKRKKKKERSINEKKGSYWSW